MVEIPNRYMRIIIMYDISTDEDNIDQYNKFRNALYKLGYYRIQYSIYGKCIGSNSQYPYEKEKIMKVIPKKSNVRILLITEKQYGDIEILSGEKSLNEHINDIERYIEI
ncbi:CRISPR-associated endonuclease Cas2 [Mycoplasma phocoeninasale]|uniref:CRISPR-associated endoribonuclease Cas2 n=2 Tax=Mycoplasma phocoeninasale TaxID=2726117 RepID=A0A858U5W1_9MOLU|nr:CRISPR-associated endonuclease Cas2 [Mycoplasma phocoeninasale]